MSQSLPRRSARRDELLERAYAYVLEHGLGALSLRPLAAAIGSSPGVLLFLFDSKDGLVRALLARARADELAQLERVRAQDPSDLASAAAAVWRWLSAPAHRPLLLLWLETYARSLVEPDGVVGDFARATVHDWLEVLAASQPEDLRTSPAGVAQRSAVLALLRGALLDLLASGDTARTTAAVEQGIAALTDEG